MVSTPIALNIIDGILGPADVAIPALHSPADGLGFLLEEFTGTGMRTMTTLTPHAPLTSVELLGLDLRKDPQAFLVLRSVINV